ncbi:MAG: hypothetical protein QNL33_04765 [Akkermansiaceae bacterium]|jgi:hypothetical protein
MKHLHHAIWAAVAAGAFYVGSSSSPDHQASSGNSRDSSAPSTLPLSGRTNPSPENGARHSSENPLSSRNHDIASLLGSTHLSDEDIALLGEEFRTAKGPIARRLAFSELLKGMTPENAKLMREQIDHLPQDSPEFREFHYAWGALAGQEAVLNGADTPKRDMAATLAGWASADPDNALAYFNSLTPEVQNGGNHMKWGAVFGLADANPDLAAEFATVRHANGDKDAGKMIHITAGAILQNGNLETAKEWAQNVPGGPLKGEATSKVAEEISKNNPKEALSWAQTLAEGDSKNRAIGSTFSNWAGQDPEAAAHQISSLSGAEKDAATYGYATRVVHDDPAVGIEWASTISDENARNSALLNTGRTFFEKNPEAAAAWLPQSGLSPELQQKISPSKRAF